MIFTDVKALTWEQMCLEAIESITQILLDEKIGCTDTEKYLPVAYEVAVLL